ncbi:hypothetical protein Pla163_12300 [Planctomycetes bacterium Pla163]|uniref:GST N-terminal domain-containing protein n=1 Tax=Rohdeia mirabilis TaxID=2528008 RepID=A0A518CY55_9BACT|nr:hypothetical protein Pla163_12300 [Planctomycetes bacterium Pla163]
MTRLRLFDLAPSPNNVKVRLALGYKGIAYERVPVDPADRAPILEATGQPLTPAIEHTLGEGVTVRLFDSGAILRYLDANFPDTPRLFSADRQTMGAIERAELRVRTEIQPCIGRIFGQFFAPSVDASECAAASAALHAATAEIEERLSEADTLVGDTITAADVTCAPFVQYGRLTANDWPEGSIQRFFAEHLALGPDRERTRAWAARLHEFDR